MSLRRLTTLLLISLAALLPALPAAAAPPDIPGYRFYAFLNIDVQTEEPLPTLIRRELPDDPAIWPQVEQYVSREFPQAFTRPGSRVLSRRASIRLPMYRRPSQQAQAVEPVTAPPPPPPVAEEAIVGALIDADESIERAARSGARQQIKAIDNVRRGDTLSTGARSSASLRLLDGTLILMRPNSAVLLKDFRFAQADGNAGALNIELLRGGIRTVSGMIPKDPRSKYLLETPGGQVTVRGTDYAVRWCPEHGACTLDGEPAKAGLYAGVLEGGIDLPHAAGASPADAGDVVHVASVGRAADPAPEMAPLVFTPPELERLPKRPKPKTECRHGPRDAVVSSCVQQNR